jgi:hypothetical protein
MRIFRLPKVFQWRVRLAQQAYDLGFSHGIQVGKKDKHNEILEMLNHNIETIDWVREEPIQVRDIIPMVENHEAKEDNWENFKEKSWTSAV